MRREVTGGEKVELYRARTSPYEWDLEATLPEDVRAADPALTEISLNSAEGLTVIDVKVKRRRYS